MPTILFTEEASTHKTGIKMKARIERGRIKIQLEAVEESIWLPQKEELFRLIGSSNSVKDDERQVSCALSVHNFKKLRKLGCGLSQDTHTQEVIKLMKLDWDLYTRESECGNATKEGLEWCKDYVFKKKPYPHQILGFQFLHSMSRPALFGDCGTGKTFMVLTYGESLMQKEKWCFLVICPVNLIRHVWITDADKFTNLSCLGLREDSVVRVKVADFDKGADKKDPAAKKKARRRATLRRNKLLKERFQKDAEIYVLNPENLRTDPKEKLVKELLKRKIKEGYKVCLVIDESSKLKSRTSRTYKALKRLRAFCEECIIMTGTPSPNGILDLWAQFSVLDDGLTLQKSFTDFRSETHTLEPMYGVTYKDSKGVKQTVTTWKPKREAPGEVYATIKNRMIRFRTDDCIDLPPVRILVRDVPLSKEQADVYDDMENMLYTELEGEPSTAKIAVGKLIKLREITGGFIRTDKGKDIQIGKTVPKLLEMDMLLEQSIADKLGDDGPPSKALIWANYRWECKTLVERYKKKYNARGLFGGISASAKDKAIERFKNDPKSRLLVCHPASVGHGLTMTEANFAFYYSLSYNYEELYQSYRRINRPGQDRPMTYYFLVAPDTIDEELLEAMRAKKDLSDLITDGKFDRQSFLNHRKDQRNETFDIGWSVGPEQTT